MVARIFIDGESGTTGLEIRERLVNRPDISLISLGERVRKDREARRDALNECDLAILCLPDEAAREAVSLIERNETRVIDASTAHRTDAGWTYGFPEMTEGQAEEIRISRRVANPGCYPTGAIAVVRPLVAAGLVPPDYPVTVNAISGYSGGGKSLIAQFEGENAGSVPSFYTYGLALTHKHLPELQHFSLLDHAPLFVPSVGPFYRGMLVQVPIQLWALPGSPDPEDIHAALTDHYEAVHSDFVSIAPLTSPAENVKLNPETMNGTNRLEINMFSRRETGQCLLTATLDNLGKGASGAAIQSMNLMLGLDPHIGLAG